MLHAVQPASAVPISSPLTVPDLIRAESAAWERLEAASAALDDIATGRTPMRKEQAEYDAANPAQTAAFEAALSATPTCAADLIAQMDLFDARHMHLLRNPYADDLCNLFASARAYLDPVRYFSRPPTATGEDDCALAVASHAWHENALLLEVEADEDRLRALREDRDRIETSMQDRPATTLLGLKAKAAVIEAPLFGKPTRDLDDVGQLVLSLLEDIRRIDLPKATGRGCFDMPSFDPECPVERLGREHKVLSDICHEWDAAGCRGDNSREGRWLKSFADASGDREYAIRKQVADYDPRSLAGVVFQLAIASFQLDSISERGVILAETEAATEDERRRAKSEIEELTEIASRGLDSAGVFLMRHLPDRGDCVGASGFLGVSLVRELRSLVADRLAAAPILEAAE